MKKYNYVDKRPKKKSAVALTFKIIATLLVVGAFTFCLVWTITNWDTVKNAVTNGTNIATEEDVNNAFKDGYNEGIKDKDNYTALINDYKSKYETELEKKTQLEKSVLELQSTINVLTTQKTELETQVGNLTTIKTNNENTIADLNNQITSLKFQVTTLTNSNENKAEQIEQLNTQISNLQSTVSQLQTTNDLNLQTITSLNTQIASLNTQITEMTTQSQNSNSQINALNNRINELQESINYYEQYIASLETNEQVVATFEFDGSVYNIQIVNKGAKVSVIDPTSTDYVVFNYWTVDGEQIDLATYTLNTNTKIVANVTYKYDVKFVVDGANLDSQVVTQNACPTLPSNPTKDGYEFDGWTTNGVDVISNIDTTAVTQNITYTAKFTKLHTVTFMFEDTTLETQTVRNGNYVASTPSIDSTTYKVFNGWKVNEIIVDLSSFKIVSDTLVVADITNYYNVTFEFDKENFETKILSNSDIIEASTTPTKEGFDFIGWSTDGAYTINSSFSLSQDTTFYPIFQHKLAGRWVFDYSSVVDEMIVTIDIYRNGLVHFYNKIQTSRDDWSVIVVEDGSFTIDETSSNYAITLIVNSDNSLTINYGIKQFIANSGGFEYPSELVFEKLDFELEQSYLANFNKKYSDNDVICDIEMYCGVLTIWKSDISNSYLDIVVIDGVGYYGHKGILMTTYGGSSIIEITDDYLIIGNTTYTFVEES